MSCQGSIRRRTFLCSPMPAIMLVSAASYSNDEHQTSSYSIGRTRSTQCDMRCLGMLLLSTTVSDRSCLHVMPAIAVGTRNHPIYHLITLLQQDSFHTRLSDKSHTQLVHHALYYIQETTNNFVH